MTGETVAAPAVAEAEEAEERAAPRSATLSRLRIAGFIYFGWRDGRPYPGRSDYWGLHTGLIENDGAPKVSLASFRDAVRRAAG